MAARLATIGLLCAVVALVLWRISSASHAQPTAQAPAIASGAPTKITVRVDTPPATHTAEQSAPIMPAVTDSKDPWPWEGSPQLRASMQKAEPREEVAGVLTVYRGFVADAHLSSEQKKKFDQILLDTRAMLYKHFQRVNKKNLGVDELGLGEEQIKADAYQQIRDLLTPDQYDVFRREIGGYLLYMIAVLEMAPQH